MNFFFQYPSYPNGINGFRTQLWKLPNLDIFWSIVIISIHVRTEWLWYSLWRRHTVLSLCAIKFWCQLIPTEVTMETEMAIFSFFSLWKLDKNAKYCHSVSLICYKTDFIIYTEERHVKHNKNIGCYGSWLPWQQFHIILFLHKLLIQINENWNFWAFTCK